MIKRIILDFDNTMVDSTKAICETYNEIFKCRPGFEEVKLNRTDIFYNIKNFLPLVNASDDVDEIFSSSIFFEKVKPFPGAVKVLKKLIEEYDYKIIVCSYGVYKNILHKCDYIPKTFPFIKEFIPIVGVHDKSIIDMSNAYFIDDYPPNLITSTAKKENIYRFSYYTYTNIEWSGQSIPNYEYMEKLFTQILPENNRG